MDEGWRVVLGVGVLATLGCAQEPQELRKGDPSSFGRFGRSIAVSASTAIVGAYQEDGGEGAAYVFARSGSTWSIRARLKASDPSHAEFGDAVAISANTAVVGASSADQVGAFRAGKVYVFENAGGVWSEQARLSPPTPEAWQAFGVSVAIDGDRVVVGSVDRDQGAQFDAGAAYVFERSGGTWSAPVMLSAPSPVSQDKFGSSVAVLGSRVFVGALRRDGGGLVDSGAVYVYAPSAGGWALTQTLTASDRQANDVFGVQLAVSGNAATLRLLVGASGADLAGGLTDAGAAYLFTSAGGGAFTQTSKLVASDASSSDIFGSEVALEGGTALIGAPLAAGSSSASSGAAYLFDLGGTAPAEEAKLVPPGTSGGVGFGGAVALGGTFALVGTTEETFLPAVTNAGAVHSFQLGPGAGWEAWQRLTASGKDESDGFGRGVALSADTLAVTSVDAVDVLRRDQGGWSLVQQLPPADPGTLNGVAIDGTRLAFMGSRQDRDATHPVGYADLYARDAAGTWAFQQRVEPDLVSSAFPQESANSSVVALDGSRLVLGCPRWNGGDGRVFVYDEAAGVFALTQRFDAPNALTNFDINFGRAIALEGNLLVVSEVPSAGVPGQPYNGRVFVYEATAGAFSLVQTLTAPTPLNGDFFGRGVALAGDLLVIAGETSGAATMLRTYRRTGGVFTETWNAAVDGLSTRVALALEGDVLFVGASDAAYSGLATPGQVLRYQREPTDAWTLAATYRAPRARSGDHYGAKLAFAAGRLAAASERFPSGGFVLSD